MKKATLIIVGLLSLSVGLVRAEEGLKDDDGASQAASSTLTPPSAPPLLLAQALPGMKANVSPNPVHLLPGMSAPMSGVAALPQPVITDLTNAPNPFDSRKGGLEGETQISYQLAKDAKVSVEMYSLLGRKVRGWTFNPGNSGGRQGLNAFLWDGTNEAGQKVSKGGYLAQIVIETPETTVTAIRKIGVIH